MNQLIIIQQRKSNTVTEKGTSIDTMTKTPFSPQPLRNLCIVLFHVDMRKT